MPLHQHLRATVRPSSALEPGLASDAATRPLLSRCVDRSYRRHKAASLVVTKPHSSRRTDRSYRSRPAAAGIGHFCYRRRKRELARCIVLLVLLALSVEIALRAKCDGSQPVSCTLDSCAIVSTDSRSCRPALDEPVILSCYS